MLTGRVYVPVEKSTGKLVRMDPVSISETCIFFILPSTGFNAFDPTVLDHSNSDKYSNSLLQYIQVIV